MTIRNRWLPVCVAVIALIGCGTGKPRPARIPGTDAVAPVPGAVVLDPVPESRRRVNTKNYELGSTMTAGLGTPMIKVRDYEVVERVVAAVVARPFHQLCPAAKRARVQRRAGRVSAAVPASKDTGQPPEPCREGRLRYAAGQPGDRHGVAGIVRQGGDAYYAVRFDGDDGVLYVLADEKGRLKPGRYLAWHGRGRPAAAIELLDTAVPLAAEPPLFRYEREQVTTADAAGSGFEILYRGVTHDHRGQVYHLFYREFGRGTPTVPIHVQDLEFSRVPETIDLLGMRLRVTDVQPERITFSVLSD